MGVVDSSEPELESQCIDAVQVISKQSLVMHEAQVLIKSQGGFVCDFSLQHHLLGEQTKQHAAMHNQIFAQLIPIS